MACLCLVSVTLHSCTDLWSPSTHAHNADTKHIRIGFGQTLIINAPSQISVPRTLISPCNPDRVSEARVRMLNIRYYILTATIQSNVTYVIHRLDLEASSEPAEILSSTVIFALQIQTKSGREHISIVLSLSRWTEKIKSCHKIIIYLNKFHFGKVSKIKNIKGRDFSLPRWPPPPPPLGREFIVDFYRCFLQYKKELQGELKGFESQILIKKGYNEHSIKILPSRVNFLQAIFETILF